MGLNPTWGSSQRKRAVSVGVVVLPCLFQLFLIVYPLSLEIGIIGGLITLAFSYILSSSFPCLSGGIEILALFCIA